MKYIVLIIKEERERESLCKKQKIIIIGGIYRETKK